MWELTRQDLKNFIAGARVLACGGGGSVKTAQTRINEIYDAGAVFRVVKLSKLPDDELLFIVGAVGGGVSKAAQQAVANLPQIDSDLFVNAAKVLAWHLKQEPIGFIASEIGTGNGVVPMYVAAKLGKVVVDADCCGRAKPEIAISTTNLGGLSITPLSMVSPFGDSMVLDHAVDDQRAEIIARHVAVASGGVVGVARCPARVVDYKRVAIEGSISRCVQLGEVLHKVQDTNKDVIHKIITVTHGFRLFSGKITKVQQKDAGGFTTGRFEIQGTTDIKGIEESKGRLIIWFKNEYLAAWLDETPLASSPDSICVIDAQTGEGMLISEGDLKKNRQVVVIGVPSASIWRSPRGITLFGPSHFNLKMNYTPMEDRIKKVNSKRAKVI